MKLYFRWTAEERPGPQWLELYERAWPAYRTWFLKEGEAARPDVETCRRKLGEHMPELIPTWEHLVDLAGGSDEVARMLSLWRPAPYIGGCSQAIWLDDEPLLVRNYDFHPHACEGLFLRSSWHGRQVLASSDCLWGALDGMNESGLVAALSFGGRRARGRGFGIPLILRYVLEFCTTTAEAVKVLKRVPSNMAYNLTLLDREGRFALVELGPDRDPQVLHRRVSTNHQNAPLWRAYQKFSRSQEREEHLRRLLRRKDMTAETLIDSFLEPPLYAREHARGSGTLYTVVYRPTRGKVEYIWPGGRQKQSLRNFRNGQIELRYL